MPTHKFAKLGNNLPKRDMYAKESEDEIAHGGNMHDHFECANWIYEIFNAQHNMLINKILDVLGNVTWKLTSDVTHKPKLYVYAKRRKWKRIHLDEIDYEIYQIVSINCSTNWPTL